MDRVSENVNPKIDRNLKPVSLNEDNLNLLHSLRNEDDEDDLWYQRLRTKKRKKNVIVIVSEVTGGLS